MGLLSSIFLAAQAGSPEAWGSSLSNIIMLLCQIALYLSYHAIGLLFLVGVIITGYEYFIRKGPLDGGILAICGSMFWLVTVFAGERSALSFEHFVDFFGFFFKEIELYLDALAEILRKITA